MMMTNATTTTNNNEDLKNGTIGNGVGMSNDNENGTTSNSNSSQLTPMDIEWKALIKEDEDDDSNSYDSDEENEKEYNDDNNNNDNNKKHNDHQQHQHQHQHSRKNYSLLYMLWMNRRQLLVGWDTKLFQRIVLEYLYPPDVPNECQLFRKENIAIPACYLMVGLMQGLGGPLWNVYPLDLNATEAQQTSISSIRSLPASCKLIFGFISDNVPLWGYRRKSYMFVGWFLASCSILCILLFSNTSLQRSKEETTCSIHNPVVVVEDYTNNNNNTTSTTTTTMMNSTTTTQEQMMDSTMMIVIPPDAPSIAFLSLCVFGFGFGLWFADVMGDSLVAEKAKLEPEHSRGSIQSTSYAYRFFGSMVAAPLSTYLYNRFGPTAVFILLGTLPLCMLPLIVQLGERSHPPMASTKQHCQEIYSTVCSRAVWQPMGFVFLYNAFQIGNAAWKQFLKTGLHFTSCQLNMLYVVAGVLLYVGIVTYKTYMIHWSWRKVYVFTTALNAIFSSLQILLILGITFGLSNFLFALGDDVFMDFISGIQFLPTTIMMVHLCPTGSEGVSYAMFTTVSNSAYTLSSAISTMLLPIWDVSKQALQYHQYNGLIKLTIVTTALQTLPILFVRLLPHHRHELNHLKTSTTTSRLGGTIFLCITFLSMGYAIALSVLNIIAPGWMGES